MRSTNSSGFGCSRKQRVPRQSPAAGLDHAGTGPLARTPKVVQPLLGHSTIRIIGQNGVSSDNCDQLLSHLTMQAAARLTCS